MRNITVKYLKQDKRSGSYVYRRRVPKVLEKMVTKREFIEVVGKTQQEAIVRYGPVHERIEHLVALAKNGVTGLSPKEQSDRLAALLASWGADPYGPGQDDNERTWREEAADRLVAKYQDPHTGEYRGVPEQDGILAGVLVAGVERTPPKVTVTDAFKFYLEEKADPILEKRKKQKQRFARAERNLTFVLGGDRAICNISREDARKLRDMRENAGVSPSTVSREMNDIRAVINLANSELSAGETNPFNGLKLKKASVARQKQRSPLPQKIIDAVYKDLQQSTLRDAKALLQIWTLLDHTGARPSEISKFRRAEFLFNHPVPHIVIQPGKDRSLKSEWSERRVPLVGAALEVAEEVVAAASGGEFAFPRFASAGGGDRLSQALTKRVRAHSEDPKHVPYSLRHNMKDRMRSAEVYPETARAIEGHAYSAGQDGSYGSEIPLERKKKP